MGLSEEAMGEDLLSIPELDIMDQKEVQQRALGGTFPTLCCKTVGLGSKASQPSFCSGNDGSSHRCWVLGMVSHENIQTGKRPSFATKQALE